MARDRLAAMRSQRHGSQGDDRYEMTGISVNGGSASDGMTTFYAEISSIQDRLKTYDDNVLLISELHSRSLNNTDVAVGERIASQLDRLVAETSSLSNELKSRIQNLRKKTGNARDDQIRAQQFGMVNQRFVEAMRNYQETEQQFRTKYEQRMERQLRIVKPDATPEEVRAVIEYDQGGQIFIQALQSSVRYGESRAAYREVLERHEEVRRIERTLGQLAQLSNDMSILVEQQDETVDTVQAAAVDVARDTEIGLRHTDKAVASARAARRKRWIVFIIFLVILAVIGIILGIVFGTKKGK